MILVASEQTNLLLIPPTFRLYQTFHSKIENTEFNLSHAILGGLQQNQKPSPAQHIDSPEHDKDSIEKMPSKDSAQKYEQLAQKLVMAQPVVSKSKFNFDEILEKPEITSFIPDLQFKQMQQVSLAYALYEEPSSASTSLVMGG